ncbi:MAG: BCCT family transporter, partial [Myxococcota bacterium]
EPTPQPTATAEPRLDRTVFGVSLVVLILTSAALLVDPEASLERLRSVHKMMTHDLGYLFLAFVFGGLIWLLWLSLSRFGDVVLGVDGEPPAYSNISWFGMLFCAGIGSNLLYFGTTEWMGYALVPPPISGVLAGSPEALDWAGAMSFFHWGISAWGVYAMATIPIAYTLHVKRSSTLRVSTACEEVLGDWVQGPLGKLLDILFIIGLVGGVGTSLGIGVPMLSAVASDLFGVERGTDLDIAILVGLTAVFAYSVSAGLDKGIKLLSDINVVLAIAFLAFVLLFGPTSFIINQAFDSLALMFANFVEMSLRTDAGNTTSFAADNTVFFWAWWLSWAPFMGLFVARISGGRTIQQVIVGTVVGGSVACWVGFSILGHSTMALVNDGQEAMTALITAAKAAGGGVDAPQVVVELLGAQPLSVAVSALFFILSFIFVATSLDSAAFTLASAASQDLPPEGQPPRWHRLVWAFVLAGIAFTLMQAGGLQVLQAASVIAGLPLVAVMFVMMRSVTQALAKRDG